MPSQTFFNLPPDKRERIVSAAIDELSEQMFASASIARIVEKAEISRGSFYQYFSDLTDLYKYLFSVIGEKKMQYINQSALDLSQGDFMAVIRSMYAAGLNFAKEHPKLARLGNNFYKEDAAFRQQIMGEFAGMSTQYFERLLQNGQRRGVVDSGIDVKVAAFLFHTVHIALVESTIEEHGTDLLLSKEGHFMEHAEKVLFILENGLKPRA